MSLYFTVWLDIIVDGPSLQCSFRRVLYNYLYTVTLLDDRISRVQFSCIGMTLAIIVLWYMDTNLYGLFLPFRLKAKSFLRTTVHQFTLGRWVQYLLWNAIIHLVSTVAFSVTVYLCNVCKHAGLLCGACMYMCNIVYAQHCTMHSWWCVRLRPE